MPYSFGQVGFASLVEVKLKVKVKVVTYRVQSDLIHHNNPSLLNLLFQLLHSRRDVRRRDHMLLGPDSRLDHLRVERVRNQ